MLENKNYFGYSGKGNRYFWKIRGEINFDYGFKSKNHAKEWLDTQTQPRIIEWTAGFIVKFYHESTEWVLVDRKGNEVSYM